MRYAWREGRGLDANQAAEEFERIRGEHGGALQAADVVDAARPDGSFFHSAFEWDDAAAAEQFRIGEARRLIKDLRVIHEEAKPSAPAYLNVTTESERAYFPLSVVVATPSKRESVLAEMRARIAHYRSEMAVIGGLQRVDEAAGELVAAIDRELAGSTRG